MLRNSWLVLGLAVTALASACAVSSQAPPPGGEQPGQPVEGEDSGTTPPAADAGADAPPPGLGKYAERGLAFVAVSPVSSTSCNSFCATQGGKCTAAIAVEGGGAAGGKAMYFASPSLYVPRSLTCAEVATPTFREDIYYPRTPRLVELTCACDNVPIKPRVVVDAPSSKSCNEVCASWKKTCEPAREWELGLDPSGGFAVYGQGDVSLLDCATTVPAKDKSNQSLLGYTCACK
jgi:hypothetical protein